jgi:hypothetical protein
LPEKAKLPNFFLVGAMKSGTTSLYQYLAAHPQAFLSPIKEPQYFCKERPPQPSDRANGIITDWEDYVRLFEQARYEVAVGEASTGYLYSRFAADEIHRMFPKARILIILRDPAERAYSQYLTEWRWNYNHASFRESLSYDRVPGEPLAWVASRPHIAISLYHDQVKRYLDTFGTDQVRVYLFDDLKRDVDSLMSDVCGFLGLEQRFAAKSFEVRFNRSAKPRFVTLDRFLVEPLSSRLLTPAMRARLRERLRRIYYRQGRSIDPADRAYLAGIFRDDILKLQDLIHRDLSPWLR